MDLWNDQQQLLAPSSLSISQAKTWDILAAQKEEAFQFRSHRFCRVHIIIGAAFELLKRPVMLTR